MFEKTTLTTAKTLYWLTIGSGEEERRAHVKDLVPHMPQHSDEAATQPRGMAISPCGRWLAVCGQTSHHLSLYALDPDSGLPSEHNRVPTGEEPICVEMPAT